MKYLNHYRVRIMKNGTKTFGMEKINIIAENDDWYVLDTDHFDKVTKSKLWEGGYNLIDKPSISKRDNVTGYFENHPEFGNGVYYDLYTEKTKRSSTIRAEIQDFLDEKFGYLANIDLSFIE